MSITRKLKRLGKKRKDGTRELDLMELLADHIEAGYAVLGAFEALYDKLNAESPMPPILSDEDYVLIDELMPNAGLAKHLKVAIENSRRVLSI
jgi:hypothetical protein